MSAKPPALPGSAEDNPIDHALVRVLVGDHEGALRWLTPLVAANPTGATGLYLTGRCFAALGKKELASAAYDAAAARAIDSGSLPLAVAAARDLEVLGADPGPRFDEIARSFHRGSPRIQKAQPPNLPGPRPALKALGTQVSGAALIAAATSALDDAVQKLEVDRSSGGGASKVSAQALFSSFGEAALRGIIDVFDVVLVPAGKRVITQGELGDEAFVIGRGELEVVREGAGGVKTQLARLGPGALIGEMSLLSRSPRAAHVEAKRPSVLLVARKASLDAVAERAPEVAREFAEQCRRRLVENLVRTSPILGAVSADERPALVERFVTRMFEAGDRIIEQGQSSDGLHLIASGEVDVVHREDEDATLIAKVGVGEVVGEVALVLRRPSNADVVASLPTITLHLPHERFLDVVKEHPNLLAQLYTLAVQRDEETSRLVAADATDVGDVVLI